MERRRFTRSCSVKSRIFSEAFWSAWSAFSSSSSESSLLPLPSSTTSWPKISALSCFHLASSWANCSGGSALKMLIVSSPFMVSSSRSTSCVICSSSSTRSRPSTMAGKSTNFFLHTWKRPSMTYWTRLSMSPSWRMLRNRSKIAVVPGLLSSSRACPHSCMKLQHTSMESSVTRSNSNVATCSASSSLTTFWFTRCAMNLMTAVVTILSFLL
mmetsp:Transcript_20772/g.58281  ORF Transcript_20772/g.58281 Transcript_20772/m.58281 type:complete len:213 (-) Transcript_20772:189-827(-)